MIRSSRLAWTHELSIGSSNFGHLLVSRAPETPFFPNDFLQRWWSRSWSLQKNQQQVMLSRLICALQGSGTKRWRITGNLQLKGVGERLAESVASNSASCFKAGVFIEKPGIWGFIFSTCWNFAKFCRIARNFAFRSAERGGGNCGDRVRCAQRCARWLKLSPCEAVSVDCKISNYKLRQILGFPLKTEDLVLFFNWKIDRRWRRAILNWRPTLPSAIFGVCTLNTECYFEWLAVPSGRK